MIFRAVLLIFFTANFSPAQYKNIQVNKMNNLPNEVSVAINPFNPANIVAGANINNIYYSFDGGLTWGNSTLSSAAYGVWGDPCIVFDLKGIAYYFHLSRPSQNQWIDRIVCQNSTDGGISWNDPGTYTGLNLPKKQDKEWACVDLTDSPWQNNIYVTWTQFDAYKSLNPLDSSNIMFSRSSDGGQTWSRALRINRVAGDCLDSGNTVEGAVPCIGPYGQVYVGWSGPAGIVLDRSFDGGFSWDSQDIMVTEQPGGWSYDIDGIYRCNGLPVTACDISSGPYRGTIYINWSDRRNGKDDVDIFLIKSTDGGSSWSRVIRVNNDPPGNNKQQFMSWMSVDPATGSVNILYYDRRNHGDKKTDVYYARSTDGGDSFSNIKVSEEPFEPVKGIFFGDYLGISSYNDFTACMWQRLHDNTISIIFCGIDFKIE